MPNTGRPDAAQATASSTTRLLPCFAGAKIDTRRATGIRGSISHSSAAKSIDHSAPQSTRDSAMIRAASRAAPTSTVSAEVESLAVVELVEAGPSERTRWRSGVRAHPASTHRSPACPCSPRALPTMRAASSASRSPVPNFALAGRNTLTNSTASGSVQPFSTHFRANQATRCERVPTSGASPSWADRYARSSSARPTADGAAPATASAASAPCVAASGKGGSSASSTAGRCLGRSREHLALANPHRGAATSTALVVPGAGHPQQGFAGPLRVGVEGDGEATVQPLDLDRRQPVRERDVDVATARARGDRPRAGPQRWPGTSLRAWRSTRRRHRPTTPEQGPCSLGAALPRGEARGTARHRNRRRRARSPTRTAPGARSATRTPSEQTGDAEPCPLRQRKAHRSPVRPSVGRHAEPTSRAAPHARRSRRPGADAVSPAQ